MNYASFGLWAVTIHQSLQINAVEIFHRIIEHTFGGSTEIIHSDSTWVIQLACDLHFAFKLAIAASSIFSAGNSLMAVGRLSIAW